MIMSLRFAGIESDDSDSDGSDSVRRSKTFALGRRFVDATALESAALRDEDDHYAALIGEVEACAKTAFEIMGPTNVPEDASRLRGASRISASRRRGRTFFG